MVASFGSVSCNSIDATPALCRTWLGPAGV